jgi:hypothetical protein
VTNLNVAYVTNNYAYITNLQVNNAYITNAFITNLTVNNFQTNQYTSNIYTTNIFQTNNFFTYNTNFQVIYNTNVTVITNNNFVSNFFNTNILQDFITSNYFNTNILLYVTNVLQTNVSITNIVNNNNYVSNFFQTNVFNNTTVSNYYYTNLYTTVSNFFQNNFYMNGTNAPGPTNSILFSDGWTNAYWAYLTVTTNLTNYGQLSNKGLTGTAGSVTLYDTTGTNQISSLGTNLQVIGSVYSTNLTASTVLEADANKGLVSIANASGALTNNGSGTVGYYNSFATQPSANAFTASNYFSVSFDTSTNQNQITPDFSLPEQLMSTNAAFTFLAPVGVNAGKVTAQWTLVMVTNTTAAAVLVTAPANCHAVGTMYVTNLTAFWFQCYAQKFTNCYATPVF